MNLAIYINILNHILSIVGWENDSVCLENIGGTKRWYSDSKLHRADGPAIEYADGDKYWYLNGLRHRTNGPAVELTNGAKEWWLNGKQQK